VPVLFQDKGRYWVGWQTPAVLSELGYDYYANWQPNQNQLPAEQQGIGRILIQHGQIQEQASTLAKSRKSEPKKEKQQPAAELAKYRYIDNGDGTVTDNRTGLIWLKNANCFGKKDWRTAKQLAAQLADGQCGLSDGSKPGDWRLPTRDEYQAMRDQKYTSPALSNAAGTAQWQEGDAFSSVHAYHYWSSTEYASNSDVRLGRVPLLRLRRPPRQDQHRRRVAGASQTIDALRL
jgi:hypothetical protein